MTNDPTGAGDTPGEPTQPMPAEPGDAAAAAAPAGAAAAGAAAGAMPPPGSTPPPGGTVPPEGPKPWYKNPTVLIVLGAAIIAAIIILIVALSGDDDDAATSDSTTTTVETTVPETTVPETTVPETTVPETTVPETTVPETTVPETTVPETTVPETTVPETTTPPDGSVPDVTIPEGGGSLVDILSGNDDLSVVWGIIQDAGLDAVLEASPGPYTVFAPTNEAFEGVDLPTGNDLSTLILSHVVPASLDSTAVLAETELTTLSTQKLAVDAANGTVGGAKVLVVDLEGATAPVGYLHVVDALVTATP